MMMTVLGTKGYERTLTEMKARLGDVLGWEDDDDVPSASALCQARRKLNAKRCAELVSQVRQLCTTARSCASVGYAGLRLVALDGTKLALPAYAALQQQFGCPTHGEGKELSGPQASLTVLWDVGANQPIAWHLGTCRTSEQTQATSLVESVGRGDLVLGDRNFPSRRFLTTLHRRQADVLMRVRTDSKVMREVTAFLASDAQDAVVQIEARDEQDQPCPDLNSIRVRLLRTRLPDGSTAVFVTSLLDQQRHPAHGLIDLYTQRWRIETAFRELKIWHGLEQFHARHVDGIAQEITAVMIFQLLASELEAQARRRRPQSAAPPTTGDAQQAVVQRPTVRFNRRIVADCAIDLIVAAAADRKLEDVFRYSLFRIWRYRQTPKAGRSFPRERKSAHRGWKPRGTKGKRRP